MHFQLMFLLLLFSLIFFPTLMWTDFNSLLYTWITYIFLISLEASLQPTTSLNPSSHLSSLRPSHLVTHACSILPFPSFLYLPVRNVNLFSYSLNQGPLYIDFGRPTQWNCPVNDRQLNRVQQTVQAQKKKGNLRVEIEQR